jgi:hypothetical protein
MVVNTNMHVTEAQARDLLPCVRYMKTVRIDEVTIGLDAMRSVLDKSRDQERRKR